MPDRVRPDPILWHHRLRVLIRPLKAFGDITDQFLPALYVAGDLDHIEIPALEAMATSRDYQSQGSDGRMRIFRRLDARWLSFLNLRLQVAAQRAPLHPTTAARWAAILAWSEARWTTDRVSAALQMHPDTRYMPPALPAAA